MNMSDEVARRLWFSKTSSAQFQFQALKFVQFSGKGGYDSGWTEGLYAGRVQGRGNEGFWPVRDEKSK